MLALENRGWGPIVLYLLLLFSRPGMGGNDNVPGGARSSALGNASVCLQDVWSAVHNQAGLAGLRQVEFAAGYESPFFVPGLLKAGFVSAFPFRSGTFSLTASSFGSSAYQENTCGLGYARAFGKKFSAGVQLDYLGTVIAEGYGSRNAVSVEIGILTKPVKDLLLGIHLSNPTRTILAAYSDERYPTVLSIGLSYSFSQKMMLAVEAEKDSRLPSAFKTGFEYRPAEKLAVRAGVCGNPWLFSFGTGFNFDGFRLDFSSSWHPVLGFTPGISIAYVFSKKKPE